MKSYSLPARSSTLRLTLALLLTTFLSGATAAAISPREEEQAEMERRLEMMKKKSPDLSITRREVVYE